MFWLTTNVMPAIITAATTMSAIPMTVSIGSMALPPATARRAAWRG
jgi:hypothetical protein